MRFWSCLLFVIYCLSFSAQALELGGYYENDLVGGFKKDNSSLGADVNRLRLKLDQKFNENLALHLEPRYYFMFKSANLPLAGVTDLDKLVWDRVYLKYYSPLANLTAGKQRIAWGSGYIWNPTDIFNPFVLSFAVREEETANAQAVRLEIPVGPSGGIDGYVVTNQPWGQAARGVRAKQTLGLFDVALSYVDQGALGHQIGFDTTGDIIKDVGVRCELVLKTPAAGSSYVQSVWGGEYTLGNGVGLNLEYFFNGLGQKEMNNYDWAGLNAGTINQLGMDYLFFSANKIIDEITNVRGSLLMNLNDQSFLLYPSYTRNISQNIDLYFEAMFLGGQEGSEYNPAPANDTAGLGGIKLIQIRFVYNF